MSISANGAADPGGLTVLRTDEKHTASKHFKLNGNGFAKVRDYDLGFWFTAQTFEAENLSELAGCIEILREHGDRVIVRGGLDELYYERIALNPDYRLTRRKNDKKDGLTPHLREKERQWGMFDVDGYPLRPDDDLAVNPGPVIDRCVRDIFPPEFHDATFYWQLSSSAGLVEGVLKAHLWCWFDRPYENRYLRYWIKVNAPYVDIAPFNCNQPHFIADPLIDGASDPVIERTGWLRQDAKKNVTLSPLPEQPTHQRKKRMAKGANDTTVGRLNASSVQAAIDRMGDGDGLDGFHRPLLAAGMAYARLCAKGLVPNVDKLKATLRAAIKDAPKRHDRGDAGVEKYLKDDYLDSQINGAFQFVENELAHENLPDMDMPLGYGWTAAGLWYTEPQPKKDKNGKAVVVEPLWVCARFDAIGVCEDGDGGDWGTVLRWIDPKGHDHIGILTHDLFHDHPMNIAKRLAKDGLKCNRAAHSELVNFLIKLEPDKSLVTVNRSGWHGEHFVLADGTIYGDDDIFMDPKYVRTGEACGVAGTLDEWREQVGKYCVGNSRLMLFASAALSGYLLDIMAEPSGGFHLYGPSSSGKSTAIFAAGSMAGRGKRGANVHQWATTSNGLEAVAAQNCDGCLAMDEIGQAQAGEAGEQIYRLCNETSKNRMTRDITMRKTTSWRIMVLSTGEVTLGQRMGEAGKKAMIGMEMRLVNVPSDGGAGHGLFENLHGFASGGELSEHLRNAAATYYGTPARAFLEGLVELRRDNGSLYEDLKAKRATFLSEHVPAGADGQVRYVAGRFGVVAIAGEMAIAWGILPGENGDAEAACVRCFKDWLRARGTTGSGEKQNGIRAVQHFLELHGSSRFAEIQTFTRDKAAPWQSIVKDADEPREQLYDCAVANMAGYKQWDKENKRTVFMISQEVWKNEVCKGMDGDLVAKAIDEKGWLIREGNHLAKLKRLPDQAKRVRLFHVTSDILAAEQDEEQAGEQQ
jgi:uncharacterized protein (DUF927 family)